MTGRALAFASTTLVLVGVGVSASSSCVGDDTLVAAINPTGIPCLRINSPVDGQCVAVSSAPGAYIPVSLDGLGLNGFFVLRPPGTCMGVSNCGYAQLSVRNTDDPDSMPVVNNSGSTTVIDLLFDERIANRYGNFEIRVDLLDDFGNPWQPAPDAGPDATPAPCSNGHGDGPYTATIHISTLPSCSTGTAGGGGGGTGGAGGTGGGVADAGDGG